MNSCLIEIKNSTFNIFYKILLKKLFQLHKNKKTTFFLISELSFFFSCQVDEPFLIPKVPRDSFISLSSSGSSIGVNQPKCNYN